MRDMLTCRWASRTDPFPAELSFATNITDIHVDLRSFYLNNFATDRFYDVARIWARCLLSVKKLSLSYLVYPRIGTPACIKRAVTDGNICFGIESNKKEARTSNERLDITRYWKAKEGEVLVWYGQNILRSKQ